MLSKKLLGVALGLALPWAPAQADINAFLHHGMSVAEAVQAAAQMGDTPDQMLLDAVDKADRLKLGEIFESLVTIYPHQTLNLVRSAIQMDMSAALVVAIATAAHPDRVGAITEAAIASGADPLEVVSNTTYINADQVDQSLAAALKAAPQNRQKIVESAIMHGADSHRVLQLLLESGEDPSLLAPATAAGVPTHSLPGSAAGQAPSPADIATDQ